MRTRPNQTILCQPPETSYQKHFGLFVDLITKYPEQVLYEQVIQPKIDEVTKQNDGCFIITHAKK